MIDSRLLPPGCIDFNLLNPVVIIMIMPFDLFGHELYRYTFKMQCEEVPELELGDDATRIFLNCHGKRPELVSQELIELLEYMEKSTDAVVEECESERIHQMHERVNRLKSSKEMEIKFMTYVYIIESFAVIIITKMFSNKVKAVQKAEAAKAAEAQGEEQ